MAAYNSNLITLKRFSGNLKISSCKNNLDDNLDSKERVDFDALFLDSEIKYELCILILMNLMYLKVFQKFLRKKLYY